MADEVSIRRLIAHGASPNATSLNTSALEEAAARGYDGIVELLIAQGADPNIRSFCGETPLHAAAGNGRAETVRLLLSHRADPNARSAKRLICTAGAYPAGATPVLVAVLNGSLPVLNMLLKDGGDPRIPDADLETPVFLAVSRNDKAMLLDLLASGGDAHMADVTGRTPIAEAAWKGNEEIISELTRFGVSVDQPDAHGMTPLMLAAQGGSANAVQALIKAGADLFVQITPNAPMKEMAPPRNALGFAAASGNLDELAAMMQAADKTNFNFQPQRDQALVVAASHSKPAAVRFLLDNGAAKTAVVDPCGTTALIAAASAGDAASSKILIDAGVSVNATEVSDPDKPCFGRTALIAAASNAHFDVVKLLLDRQANVNIRDLTGLNAVDLLNNMLPQTLSTNSAPLPPLPPPIPVAVPGPGESNPPQPIALDPVPELLRQARALSASQDLPDGPASAHVAISALQAIKRLSDQEGDTAKFVVQRSRIGKAAAGLIGRWPRPACSYGVCGNEDPKPFLLDQYDASVSSDLLLMDYAVRQSSVELWDIVASDLETKLADCLASGNGAGETLSFSFRTEHSPHKRVDGFTLFYKDRQAVGLEQVRPQSPPAQWASSASQSWGTAEIAPGNYLMFVRDGTGKHTECQWVEVGRHAHVDATFLTDQLSVENRCTVR